MRLGLSIAAGLFNGLSGQSTDAAIQSKIETTGPSGDRHLLAVINKDTSRLHIEHLQGSNPELINATDCFSDDPLILKFESDTTFNFEGCRQNPEKRIDFVVTSQAYGRSEEQFYYGDNNNCEILESDTDSLRSNTESAEEVGYSYSSQIKVYEDLIWDSSEINYEYSKLIASRPLSFEEETNPYWYDLGATILFVGIGSCCGICIAYGVYNACCKPAIQSLCNSEPNHQEGRQQIQNEMTDEPLEVTIHSGPVSSEPAYERGDTSN
jgi:hypothetical protein